MRFAGLLSVGLVATALFAQFHLPGMSSGTPTTPAPATTTTNTTPSHPVQKPSAASTPTSTGYDYFVLALSWAPNFCANAEQAARNPQECAVGKHVSFVVHGLWPEVNSGRGPENCGKTAPVKKLIVNSILPYMPSASLVQHEWSTHGTCSGLTPTEFFDDVLTARTSVQLPVQFTALEDNVVESPAQIETQFAAANSGFPEGAFRTDCVSGQLAEVRICFDKNMKARMCTSSVAECSAPEIGIRPPR